MILPYRTKPRPQTWTDFWQSERGAWVGLGLALGAFIIVPIVVSFAWMALQSVL